MKVQKTVNATTDPNGCSSPVVPVDINAATYAGRAGLSRCLAGFKENPHLFLVPICQGCDSREYWLGSCDLGKLTIDLGEQPKAFKTYCGTRYVRGTPEGSLTVEVLLGDFLSRAEIRTLLLTAQSAIVTDSGQSLTRMVQRTGIGAVYEQFDVYLVSSGDRTDLKMSLVLPNAQVIGFDELAFAPEDAAVASLEIKFSEWEFYV